MKSRFVILTAGLLVGLSWKFWDPPQTPQPPTTDPQSVVDPNADPLVPPITLVGSSPISPSTRVDPLAWLDRFEHDNSAIFHPHGEEVCASGCAASRHPTETLTKVLFHELLQEYSQGPMEETNEAYEHLLYFGPQTLAMLDLYGEGPLDPVRASVLRMELKHTHARVSLRVVDEHGEIRSSLDPTLVPLDRRHVFEMDANRVQPLVTSGTAKRVGLNHIWTRL